MAGVARRYSGSGLAAELRLFTWRRLSDLAGLSLVVFGAALALALAAYDPADPGIFRATARPSSNPLGLPGAWVASGTLLMIGIAGWIAPLFALTWGVRTLVGGAQGDRLKCLLQRLFLLPFALAFSALFASCHAPWAGWALPGVGLGGLLGDELLVAILRTDFGAGGLFSGLGTRLVLVNAVSGFLSLASLVFALGVTRKEMAHFFRLVRDGARGAWALSSALRRMVMRSALHLRRPRAHSAGKRSTIRAEPVLGALSPALHPESRDAGGSSPSGARRPEGPSFRQAGAFEQAGDATPSYVPPPLSILERASARNCPAISRAALQENARNLETVLQDYAVRGDIINVRPGPVVTLYELEPAPGIKASRVVSLADDIARSMSALSARVATVPGRNVLGIELPNPVRARVLLREMLESDAYRGSPARLPIALGKNIAGDVHVADLTPMPHLLIAGTTGSGKSVAINTMLLSLLYARAPRDCRLILIDPKMLELSVYDGVPHLLTPVVTDPKKAVVALKWTVREMEERYRKMSRLGVRNIDGYNERAREAIVRGKGFRRIAQTGFDAESGRPVYEEEEIVPEELPFIVVIVDELADLMMVAGKDIEACVQRLAQMARASGIHLIMATQRPSVDVVTGTIKANFPTRISFQVTSRIDSRTILGEQGAEQLLGRGDMLYMAGGGRLERLHGPLVSDNEIEEAVRHLKRWGAPDYLEGVTDECDVDQALAGVPGLDVSGDAHSDDRLYDQAVAVIARERRASISFIQRRLQIGYNRAARLMERMEEQGVVSAQNNVGARQILVGNPE